MKKKYDPNFIEKKWQKFWKDHETFRAEIDHSKPKYYILDMFPYPSGEGLHVGHVTGYTGTDILARFKRLQGFNVLHPMGWDSFGLPAEQHAIRTGQHPAVTTKKNISTYRRQLESLGFSYDWAREIATSDPSYYKWTQWIFTKLYEKGLAYEAEMNVNFCPALGTVLSNEEVENGVSVEGGYPVERRPLKQWILKITSYADRLLEDLDLLDWPDHLKKLQSNWIGKSEGAQIIFETEDPKGVLNVFTTRPDTLFGVTFLVLAPEHPIVESLTTQEKKAQVDEYQRITRSKSDRERSDASKEKTGVWTGSYAIHPVTSKKIPIWIADYVLPDYGSGVVMGVPGHDERDEEFANKYSIPVLKVYDASNLIIESGFLNGMDETQAKKTIVQWLVDSKKGKGVTHYKLRDWLFSRQRYWGEPFPILHFEDGTKRCLSLEELPLVPPELEDYKPSSSGKSPLDKVRNWVEIIDPKTGKKALRETNTMPQWAGSCWYYLRFADPQNNNEAFSQEAENYWLPVDMYVGGVEHAVLHLLYARFWHKVLFDCGLVHSKEPFMKLRNQGLVTARSYKLSKGGYVSPSKVEQEKDKYFFEGEELFSQIEKMSKSKLNGISPDEVVQEFGADSLRLYEMFMGPFDREKTWNPEALSGCYRFLSRFYDLVFSDKLSDEDLEEAEKLAHRLAHIVIQDIEQMQFNTAIARMMEFINAFSRLTIYPRKSLQRAVHVLYPFAPHIAEELWSHLVQKDESMAYVPFGPIDPKYLLEDTSTFVVQINGKLKGKPLVLPKNTTEEDLFKHPEVQKWVQGEVVKVIFVPSKLINIVVKT
jgi:leucyl-tRNA synthetase